jgi:hypothetical protein
MEQSSLTTVPDKKDELWKNIDVSAVTKSLSNDYTTYLTNRLVEYGKADLTSHDFKQIQNMNFFMVGHTNSFFALRRSLSHAIRDEKQNSFLHVAITKKDIPVLKWLTEVVECHATENNIDGKSPIDLCIDQLMPNADKNNRNTAHEMLDILTARHAYDSTYFDRHMNIKKSYLNKMILLQLEHTKHATNFVLKNAFLTQMLKPNNLHSFALPKIYQTVVDNEHNSYTHILVQQKLPDMLYEFIKKDYITFTKNDAGKTPLMIAQELFQLFTQCKDPIKAITQTSNEFNKRRCCLFMLLNYLRKQNQITDLQQCCEKHTI